MSRASPSTPKVRAVATRSRDLPSSPTNAYGLLLKQLNEECRERGRAQLIARATGITPQHLCRVRKGKAQIGELFARALAEFWGLDFRTITEPQTPIAGERLPNLRAALEFCSDAYPSKFLKQVEPLARQHQHDRRKPAWVAWLEANYADWREEQRRDRVPEQSGTYSWDDQDEVGHRAGNKRSKAAK